MHHWAHQNRLFGTGNSVLDLDLGLNLTLKLNLNPNLDLDLDLGLDLPAPLQETVNFRLGQLRTG